MLGLNRSALSQNYNSYLTGSAVDLKVDPSGGLCLMGGASEDDNAMTWFLQQANGGDILVLRASGSDGYNNYLYSNLGISVNSVETIVFNDSSAANEAYIHQKIQEAEAIWMAGGDQWDYISYWRNNSIDSLINDAIANRNIVIGGTSAGMAIQGGFYFSAENGTVTSASALANPFTTNITVDSSSFISSPYLSEVITDTHYDNPDRKGRHLVFLARILVDYGIAAKGIACDEYTAVCIDTNGIAKVFGGYPSYDDNAYFIQTNCELPNVTPENCSAGNPLDWNLGNEAIKVYAVKGTSSGANTFDLNDWETGTGGVWENWYVDQGLLQQQAGLALNCNSVSVSQLGKIDKIQLHPNPAIDFVIIKFDPTDSRPQSLKIVNQLGQVIKQIRLSGSDEIQLTTRDLRSGLYSVEIKYSNDSIRVEKLVVK
tara:strand:- start:11108 stop:12394 length:1287 start_codon:yes stop_codon:yes gene_type:complete